MDWSKIQELNPQKSLRPFRRDVKLRHREDANTVPQGTLSMTGQQLQVNTGAQAVRKHLPLGERVKCGH